jgi:MFS family permease
MEEVARTVRVRQIIACSLISPYRYFMQLRSRLWIRLLALDTPVEASSRSEVETEQFKNYSWNFTFNVLDGLTFWFGLAFASGTTIIPLFVSKISVHPALFALVAVLAQASWYIPQLFTAGMIERIPLKKPIVVNAGFLLERLPVIIWPVAALIALQAPTTALVLFLVAYAWHGLGAGMVGPAWQQLLARCFPVKKRGKVFGITNFAGTAFGVAGAGISGWLLDAYPFPTNFVYTFSIAAIGIGLSWVCLALVREPAVISEQYLDEKSHLSSWAQMLAIVQEDKDFRGYLIMRVAMVVGSMGLGYVTLATVDLWHASDRAVGLYTAFMLVGQTVGNLAAGLIGDRIGHKAPLVLCAVIQSCAFLISSIAPSPESFYLVFALLGASAGINIVSGILVSLEFAPTHRQALYAGIANTTVGIASAIAPVAGAIVVGYGYNRLFGVSALISLLAAVGLVYVVKNPRTRAMSSSSTADTSLH